MRHPGTALEVLFEQLEGRLAGLRMHFHISIGQVPGITSNPAAFRGFKREVAVSDTLNAPSNEIALCPYHDSGNRQLNIVPGSHPANDIGNTLESHALQDA